MKCFVLKKIKKKLKKATTKALAKSPIRKLNNDDKVILKVSNFAKKVFKSFFNRNCTKAA